MLPADAERLERRIEELSAYGANVDGGVDRVAYSQADVQAREYITGLMQDLGMQTRVDAGGNILGRPAGKDESLPPILFGSHIDSVPGGGNYDGQAGVLAALEVIELLNAAGITTDRPLEVVVFSNEEGGLIGSLILTGNLQPTALDIVSHSGLTIREAPPPPGVNSNLPPVTDAKPMTNRERLRIHMANEACVSCHKLVAPIGFGFENYDAIGRFRAKHLLRVLPTREELQKKTKTEPTEYELDINSSAFVQGVADSEFSTPRELGRVLAENRACQKCIVKQLFRYALGRHETPAERAVIDAAYEDFCDSGFRFQELLISLVTSTAFLGGTR